MIFVPARMRTARSHGLELALFFICFVLTFTAAGQEPAEKVHAADAQRALILVSRSPADLWVSSEVDGMLRVFRESKTAPPPLVEYMDWQQGGAEQQRRRLSAYYAGKFKDRKIRAIIAADEVALDFLLAERDRIFPDAEVAFCGIPRIEDSKRRSWLTGVLQETDAPGTFRLAIALQPQLERFVLIDDQAGSAATERARIESACPEEVARVKIEALHGESAQSLFAAVEKLPPNSAVLLVRNGMPPRVLDVLSQCSSAPIYGLWAPLHLRGTVGGSFLDGEAHGTAVARIALRMLAGEKASSIPVVSDVPPRLLVNYPQAQRANLPLDRLPPGTEVIDRPPSMWEQQGTIFAVAAGVILLLVGTLLFVVRLLGKNRGTAAELSRSLSTLNATFDSTADGVLVVDKEGRVSACNERFLELWNIPRDIAARAQDEAFLRQALLQLKEPSTFLARVRELYSNPEASSQGELIEFKDGRVFERDSRPLRQGTSTIGRVWSFRDVTARVRADRERRRNGDQLAEAQKMEALGNLAGGIAHDFNNILTGVIGYVELAKARLPGRHPAAEDLDHVLRASERAKDLVRQILTFSRKRAPEKRAMHLEHVVRDTLKLLRAVVPATIEIRADLSTAAGTVLADPTQIHQAVLNLATNAAHAMGQMGGQIRVTLHPFEVLPDFALLNPPLRPGSHICLGVHDTGHGMDAMTLKRIFEPFFTTKAPGEGTGLGLAVVQAIVQNHDGLLAVESEVSLGTSFRIYLPLARESEILQLSQEEETPEGHGEHILVVDDEPMITEVHRSYLESLNYRVTVAHSPEQALAEFSRSQDEFAGLVTDFNMPHMNGLELVRRMRAKRGDLPVLLCTGYIGSAATEHEAAGLKISEILGKPFTRHTLGQALDRVLKAPLASAN